MNRQFFARVVAIIVAAVCVSAPECSGWAPPLYIDSDWKVYAPVGVWAIVDAWVESGGPVYLPWSWNWESGGYQDQYDEQYSSMSWGQYSSSGIYDVYVYASSAGGSDDAHSYVYAVAVTQVISSTSAACVGQNVTFGAITNPPNCASHVTVTWSGTDGKSGSGSQFTTSWSTGGTKTVTATCGSSSAQKQVTIVQVVEVISSTNVTCVGENVTFGALTEPPNSAHLVTVTWSGGQIPPTGSGSQWTTKWSTPGTKTVTATCGTSSAQKQVKVVEVASLLPDAGTEFDDGDGNPATKSFAVTGRVLVTVTATPEPSVPEEELPSCWSLTGGTGTGKLTRTVNMDTLINAGQPFAQLTCTSGSSSKTTKIYVANPISIHAGFSFDKLINDVWYFGIEGSEWIGGFYDTRFHDWDSCLTSAQRKFDHMHATDDFAFYNAAYVPGVGWVDAYASDSDHYWTRTSYGPGTYELVSSSIFSQNCHGHAQGKGYWINNVVPLIEDDYVQTPTGGEFEYSPDHSIKIDIFYPNGNICTTSEKMQYSGVYTRTFLPPGAPPGTMYISK